jgi:hypothetical protein
LGVLTRRHDASLRGAFAIAFVVAGVPIAIVVVALLN